MRPKLVAIKVSGGHLVPVIVRASGRGRRDFEDRDTAKCPVRCVDGLRDPLGNQIVVGLVATLGATGMIEASAARSASIPFGAPCEPPTAHESWGTAHRHRRGRVAVGRQIRRDHVCELVILDCGAGHNFELELSERRIAADLAGQLHPSSIRRASLVPGQEVAVDLSLFFNPPDCDLGVSLAVCRVVPACRGA
jgi:hypothetical protein